MRVGSVANDRVTIADRGVATFFLIAAVVSILAPRVTVVMLPMLTLMALVMAYAEAAPFKGFLHLSQAGVAVVAFLGFAVLSAAWSVDPPATFAHAAFIVLIFFNWHIVDRWISVQPTGRLRHVAYWTLLAFAVGAVILSIESVTNQFLRRVFIDELGIFTPPTLNKHYSINSTGEVSIARSELNRAVATLNMFLWPALLCALAVWSGRRFKVIAAVLAALVLVATMASTHESSKLAALAGVLVFALAYFWRRASVIGVAAVWTVAVLGAVVFTHVAYKHLHLHEAGWLQNSGKHRIEIWNKITDRVAEAPLIGHGARASYIVSNRNKALAAEQPAVLEGTLARHAHNVYLQNWYELGAVGVVLFLVAGLATLRAVTTVHEAAQPFALATFTVFMTEIAPSWELWQRWFAALFALAMIFLAVAIRATESRRNSP